MTNLPDDFSQALFDKAYPEDDKEEEDYCPFCTGDAELGYQQGKYFVYCHDCEARGPKDRYSHRAIERWNERH